MILHWKFYILPVLHLRGFGLFIRTSHVKAIINSQFRECKGQYCVCG